MSLLDYQYPPHIQPIVDEMRRKADEYAKAHPPEPPQNPKQPKESSPYSKVFVRVNPNPIGPYYIPMTLEEEAAVRSAARSETRSTPQEGLS